MPSRLMRAVCFLFLFFLMIFLTVSCKKMREKEVPKAIKFEICEETELPNELKWMIDERKEKEFQLIYENSSYCYMAAGYGKQKREGYAVEIKDFYETEEKIVLDTILKSRNKQEKRNYEKKDVCPYIVIRCSRIEKPVVFK